MQIYDISWPISLEMTTYKNNGGVTFTPLKEFARDGARETTITCTSHTGTHIDAPSHFLKDGHTINAMPLSHAIGECAVVDLTQCTNGITAQHLQAATAHLDSVPSRIVCKTRNSFLAPTTPFNPEFIYLTGDAATWCVNHELQTIGIDYLGIERNQPARNTHLTLLTNNITIIEGLRLEHITPGIYQLICLPLLCIGIDGAPARAVLIEI